MSTCVLCDLSLVFMGKWEEDYVFGHTNIYKDKVAWWARFIDDVILLWNGTEDELLGFHNYLNNTNANVKLSLEYSKTKINFLDLEITKDTSGHLHTSIYRKDIHKNTLLHAKGFHPPSLINNIPYGQFQRLRRICDKEEEFETKSREMLDRFRERGYPSNVLNTARAKAQAQ